MRFIQGLAMFAATFVAGAAALALSRTVAMAVWAAGNAVTEVDWGDLVKGGGAVAAVGAIAVWGLLFVLSAVKRLRVWSAGLAGAAVGLGLVMGFMAITRAWEMLALVLAVFGPFPVAGAVAGWWVWRLTQPRVTPAEGVF